MTVAQQEVAETTQEAPSGDTLLAAAQESIGKVLGAQTARPAEPEKQEAQPEEADEAAEGVEEPVEETVPEYDKYLRKHIPQSALKKMTLAERIEALHELREREVRTLGAQKGRERKDDSPSGEPDAPRESTAARVPFSDAALSEALADIDKFSKENALDGLSPALSKPLKVLADYAGSVGAENAQLKQELGGLGAAVQSLLRDKAIDGVSAKYGAIEGSVREEFETELEAQLKAIKDKGMAGLRQAAEKAARIVMGPPAAKSSVTTNGSTKSATKRAAQPTAPTGRGSGDAPKAKSDLDAAKDSISKFFPHLR